MKFLILFVVSLCFRANSVAGEPKAIIYRFEPAITSIKGILQTRIYPGPPNYESLKTGDRAETALLLKLPKPVTVLDDGKGDSFNETEANVREIQLVIYRDKDFGVVKSLIGRAVSVTGTLFHAHTGHHHLDVLMDVREFHETKE